jgi:hypothetical protein
MRHSILKMGLGLTLGLALAGCDLTDVKKADDDTAKPATAATVIGTWRSDVAATPTTIIKLTMRVDEAGTMVLSQRVATGQPAPYDYVEISKENWTWKIENASMVSVKTDCEYKNPETMQTSSTTCTDPLIRTSEIKVKGSAWTVLENGQPVIFRKDS